MARKEREERGTLGQGAGEVESITSATNSAAFRKVSLTPQQACTTPEQHIRASLVGLGTQVNQAEGERAGELTLPPCLPSGAWVRERRLPS